MPKFMPEGKGTFLAFDFGIKRIGVAVGEVELKLAHPLTTLRDTSNADRFSAIANLIREWSPVGLVVGLPVNLDGTHHAMTARCQRFINQLHGRFGLPIHCAEERLSSVEAEARLQANGFPARDSKECLDAVAAQIILQDFFDHMTALDAYGKP